MGEINQEMKTLFLNPPSFQGFDGGAGSRYQARREVRSFWYPTWLAQAAALVEESRVVDAPVDDLTVEDVLGISRDFDMAIIYTSTPSFVNDAAIAEGMKRQRPDMIVGFVGPHVSVLPEESLLAAPSVDFVVRREFEYPVQQIARGDKLSDVKGVSWRDGDVVRHNEDSAPVEDLDGLPFVVDVYKRDLTIENYYGGYLKHPYMSIYTARGCPALCTYCLWPHMFSGRNYRVRSAESIRRELALAKEYFPQVKEFFLDDDTFTVNPRRAEEVATSLATLGITWSATSRPNVPYETLKVLKESGLRLLLVGYESGNEGILRNIKKGITTDIARRFARDCRSLGIAVHGCFIVGLPGETNETIEETIRFACEIDPDTIQVSLPAPYPGTVFYQQAVDNGWLVPTDLVSSDGTQDCPIQYDQLSAKAICEWRDQFYKRFYFRPRVMYRLGMQMLKSPEERRRRLREGREFLSFLRQH
jgi:hopanoid biosynthesis associated radical SAM protein HpnJ